MGQRYKGNTGKQTYLNWNENTARMPPETNLSLF